ncbi:unnamed protein product, partial [Rotaria sp. Silwood2]
MQLSITNTLNFFRYDHLAVGCLCRCRCDPIVTYEIGVNARGVHGLEWM